MMSMSDAAAAPAARDPVAPAFPVRLIEGYRAFMGDRFARESARYRELAEKGQKPRFLLIGCCDSRCAPEDIFDAGPGEIFVLRNVANLVPPYTPNSDFHGTSAALEFAVMGLRVEHIIVLGHARCGGVRAFAESESDPYTRPLSPGDFIGQWMKLITPAAESLGGKIEATPHYIGRLARASVRKSLENLRGFPCIRTLEERGLLALHGAFFGVMDGELEVLDQTTGEFLPVSVDGVTAPPKRR
jgi:carbonic anhydrase